MNKLFQLSVPTVAVVGTGSKQGKFTLQLQFKNFMEKLGYKVGFLSSEPNGNCLERIRLFHLAMVLQKIYMKKNLLWQ